MKVAYFFSSDIQVAHWESSMSLVLMTINCDGELLCRFERHYSF